jgi:rhodanese-related sulfurtransferase
MEGVDAHIPYVGSEVDEWSDLYKSYGDPANNLFLYYVNELVMDRGLGRNSAIYLMCSSYRRGLLAANILSVAGYANVIVEFGRQRDCAFSSSAQGRQGDCVCMRCDAVQWMHSSSVHEGGWLH